MGFDFQREFNDDSNEFDVEQIKSRVYNLKDNIIIWKRIPYPTTYSVKIMSNQLIQLAKTFDFCYVIVDLSESINRMDTEKRDMLRDMINSIPNVKEYIFVTGKNKLLHVMAKYVM
ncbi:MAG: hypothetical protein OEZ01_17115, partial [Candidatus Heimdallarchaeota archaeon]|nr:hypothetical protein [Candidatus Heimdallarchaeota archaeon]